MLSTRIWRARARAHGSASSTPRTMSRTCRRAHRTRCCGVWVPSAAVVLCRHCATSLHGVVRSCLRLQYAVSTGMGVGSLSAVPSGLRFHFPSACALGRSGWVGASGTQRVVPRIAPIHTPRRLSPPHWWRCSQRSVQLYRLLYSTLGAHTLKSHGRRPARASPTTVPRVSNGCNGRISSS